MPARNRPVEAKKMYVDLYLKKKKIYIEREREASERGE